MSHVYSLVVVYNGQRPDEKNSLAFVIAGGNDESVFVFLPNGSRSWKDRAWIENSDYLWVRANDPALQKREWQKLTEPLPASP